MRFQELDINNQTLLDNLGGLLKGEFSTNEILRRDKEKEWAESLRQVKGKYDPEVLKKLPANSSQVYIKYTRYKEGALRSIMNNIVLSENDKNWTMKPTPKPALSKEVVLEIMDSIKELKKQQLLAGGQVDITDKDVAVSLEEFEDAAKRYAAARCQKMELEIEDQLSDIDFREVQKNIIKSGLRYGFGVIEGPFTLKKKDIVYKELPDGSFDPIEKQKRIPSGEFVRCWDWYPDMSATEVGECEFIWKRLILGKHQLRQLSKKDGFFEDIINDYIRDNPSGNSTYKEWELEVEAVDSGKKRDVRKNKYEILIRWGTIDANYMVAAGIELDEEDKDKELLCCIWILGNKVIRFLKNPWPQIIDSLKNIYHVFYFDKDESSIFGTGLPRIARDMELTMGGAMRSTINNAAKVAGPQTIVNIDLLSPDEDPEDVAPSRVWKRWGRGIDAQYDAVKALNFQSHIEELIAIFDKAMSIADLELSIPMWMHKESDKSKEKKLGEISTKWPLHTIAIKDVLKSFDDCVESYLNTLYRWNMEFNDNNDLKGDFQVKARGSTALLMKELKLQAMSYITQTLNDEEREYIKTGKWLKERFRLLVSDDLSEYIKTDEEVQLGREERIRQQAEAMELARKQQEADTYYTIAKGKHMEAKAGATDQDKDIKTIKSLAGKAG